MASNLWQCEQLRAGQIYNKMLFSTQSEAEQFVRKMQQVEPDIFWRMAPVPMAAIWN